MWTRKGLLVAGGAALAAAGCGGEEVARRERRRRAAADAEIVRFLLDIERLAAAFWEAVAARGALRGPAATLAAAVARNDRMHVETLERFERRLDGSSAPAAPPAGAERLAAAGPAEALGRGARLANLAAAAYTGQLNRIQDRNLLATVLAIHSVEGRHALALGHEAGDAAPFPDGAFAEALTMDQARARLRELVP